MYTLKFGQDAYIAVIRFKQNLIGSLKLFAKCRDKNIIINLMKFSIFQRKRPKN